MNKIPFIEQLKANEFKIITDKNEFIYPTGKLFGIEYKILPEDRIQSIIPTKDKKLSWFNRVSFGL